MIAKIIKSLFYRSIIFTYKVFLPRTSIGFKKKTLADHPLPAIRRLALIALGGEIGNLSHLNQGIRIVMDSPKNANISIGERVSVAPNVQFICSSGPHPKSRLLDITYVREVLTKNKKIVIEDDVWIGAGAIILQGVSIGKCSIVGAGSLVLKDVPEYTIVAGIPAKEIRKLIQVQ